MNVYNVRSWCAGGTSFPSRPLCYKPCLFRSYQLSNLLACRLYMAFPLSCVARNVLTLLSYCYLDVNLIVFLCILYMGFSINPSGAWAAGVCTCIPSTYRRSIKLVISTTCCFICSTLVFIHRDLYPAFWLRLSLKVGGQAMQASFVAVGL